MVWAADASAADLPAADLPAADLPAADLPAADLPAADLPAADLPAVMGFTPATVGGPRTELSLLGLFQSTRWRDAAGKPLDIRRYTQHIGLRTGGSLRPDAWGYLSGGDDGPRWAFSVDLRLDAHFGEDLTVTRWWERQRRTRFALLALSVDVTRLGGVADVSLGRRVHVDETGFLHIDGVIVRLRGGFGVAVDLYGGTEVRDALSLRPEGYMLPADNPWEFTGAPHDSRMVGVYGVALALDGIPEATVRLGWRRAQSGALEKRHELMASLGYRFDPWVGADAQYAHDFAWGDGGLPARAFLNVSLFSGFSVSADVGYEYRAPRFDFDSIWAYFYSAPQRDLYSRLRWRFAMGDVEAGYAYRSLEAGNLIPREFWSVNVAHEASASVGLRWPGWVSARLSARVTEGWGGSLVGLTASTRIAPRAFPWRIDVATSCMVWRDLTWLEKVNGPHRWRVSGGGRLGFGWRIERAVDLSGMVEAFSNPVHRLQMAGFVQLDVNLWL